MRADRDHSGEADPTGPDGRGGLREFDRVPGVELVERLLGRTLGGGAVATRFLPQLYFGDAETLHGNPTATLTDRSHPLWNQPCARSAFIFHRFVELQPAPMIGHPVALIEGSFSLILVQYSESWSVLLLESPCRGTPRFRPSSPGPR